MATREENLKKINEQLEQMSDEQLEQVAGGSNVVTHWRPRFASGESKKYPIGAPEPFISVPTESKINFTGGEPKEYPIGAPAPFISVPTEIK